MRLLEARRLTAKGEATRDRIVAAAAEAVLRRGVGGTSLDDIGTAAATSRSQLFHYFPAGKQELVRAVVARQSARLFDAQRPALDDLSTWASWDAWRRAVIDHYDRTDGVLGCPIGSLAAEAAANDPALRDQVAGHFELWCGHLADGVRRMQDLGHVGRDVDATDVGVALVAAIQGGLLLAQAQGTLRPLEAALDEGLTRLRGRPR